jgi:hypothetical protein
MRLLIPLATLCLLMAAGCGKQARHSHEAQSDAPDTFEERPSEQEALKAIDQGLADMPDEWDTFRVLRFDSIKIYQAAGHKGLYFADVEGEIEFKRDCYWMAGRMFTNPVPVAGRVAVKKCERVRAAEHFLIKKTEKGWILQ